MEIRKAEMIPTQFPAKQTQEASISKSRLRWIVWGALGVAAALVVKNQTSRSSKNEESKAPNSHREDF